MHLLANHSFRQLESMACSYAALNTSRLCIVVEEKRGYPKTLQYNHRKLPRVQL